MPGQAWSSLMTGNEPIIVMKIGHHITIITTDTISKLNHYYSNTVWHLGQELQEGLELLAALELKTEHLT